MDSQHVSIYDLIILGGGPAGWAAAIHAARSKLNTLVIDKNPLAGALNLSHRIDNYPGIPEISGAELLSRIRSQAESFGAAGIQDTVIDVDFHTKPATVFTAESSFRGASIVVATGAMGRRHSITGEETFAGKGVCYCASCDAPFFEGKDVVVAGRPELFWDDLYQLSRFAQRIYVVMYPSHHHMPDAAEKLRSTPKVEVLEGMVAEISGNSFVDTVQIRSTAGDVRSLEASGIFLYLQGRLPIVDFLGGALTLRPEGCIAVDPQKMSTSVEGVYAAGDVICTTVRGAIQSVADGCRAASSAIQYVNARPQA